MCWDPIRIPFAEAADGAEALDRNYDEVAFYDAVGVNESAVQELGHAQLQVIAEELVQTVKGNVTIDWKLRENVRAELRVVAKRIPRK